MFKFVKMSKSSKNLSLLKCLSLQFFKFVKMSKSTKILSLLKCLSLQNVHA